jgi:hypothetical protein
MQTNKSEKRQALYNLFAAYMHTIPLEELIESVERARLDAKLRYVVIYGAACSYCLARAERLEGHPRQQGARIGRLVKHEYRRSIT